MIKPSPVTSPHGKPPASAEAPLRASGIVVEVSAARLLDGVSLEAGRGEMVGIIGPNGAGKSTLLKVMAGLLRRREGAVSLEGHDLDGMSPREVARTLAMVPQLSPYTYGFTSMEFVMMGRYPHMGRFQVEGAAERRAAAAALETVGLEHLAERTVTTLSGGERQRVFIARALAQAPRVLLLDEPTASLDIQHQMKVLELVRGMAQDGVTTIAAVHDLTLAARYCDRLALLHQGRIVAEGTPEAVLTPPNVERAFGVRCIVYPDPFTGGLSVRPLDTSPKAGGQTVPQKVHVVCGAGSGARLLYELHEAGHQVTAGVLGAGDTDRAAADILGVPYVPTPAFGAIDEQTHARHLAMLAEANAAVLCETPFGANNLANLQALRRAKRLIVIESRPFAERDYTSGEAGRVYASLEPAARCAGIEEALAALDRFVRDEHGGPAAAQGGTL